VTDIVLYTRPGCSRCDVLKSILGTNDRSFVEEDLSDPETLARCKKAYPAARVLPVVVLDGVYLGTSEDLLPLLN
jgi:glutaredoxin